MFAQANPDGVANTDPGVLSSLASGDPNMGLTRGLGGRFPLMLHPFAAHRQSRLRRAGRRVHAFSEEIVRLRFLAQEQQGERGASSSWFLVCGSFDVLARPVSQFPLSGLASRYSAGTCRHYSHVQIASTQIRNERSAAMMPRTVDTDTKIGDWL